jgi:hypothetical protein
MEWMQANWQWLALLSMVFWFGRAVLGRLDKMNGDTNELLNAIRTELTDTGHLVHVLASNVDPELREKHEDMRRRVAELRERQRAGVGPA